IQPHLKIFPRTVHGEKRRAFSKTWYSQHKWLEYSQSRDSVYCFACRHFSLPNASETPFTSHEGYSNWKKAMYKDGGFKGHEKSEGHTNAMYAWSEHKKNILTDSSVHDALDKAYKKKVEENRIYIKTVAEVLLLTAMQNLSQRGHLETDTSQNKGNFLELMELLSKHNPLIAKKMKAAGNAKYTSNTIQNEVIECLSEMVREDIIREVKESEYFSVIADETKDLKKTEQLTLVLRYYYNGAVQESFLEFQRASQLDAAGLTQNIIQCLERYGLEYRSNLVGQGYDGASVMAGKCRGVAARIKTEAKHAFYVHCNAHCLNLVIVDAVKAVPEAHCFFSLLQKLYVYMSGSYVHQKWITVKKDIYPEAPRELQRLSDTRWACRYSACKTVMDRLPAILRVLHEIDLENSGDRSVEARGLLAQIDLTFIGNLSTFRKILGEIKLLSDVLQSPSLDLAKAVDLIHALQDTLDQYRSESCFDELWQDRESLRLKGYFREVFYPILDHVHAEMEKRFNKTNCDIMRGIQALNPKSKSFLSEEIVVSLAGLYDCDIEDLKHELYQARKVVQRRAGCGNELSSILGFTTFLEPYKEVFHQLFRLCRIALALPVSSATCERSFSVLKYLSKCSLSKHKYFATTSAAVRVGCSQMFLYFLSS
uniref:TTF-type domain-containing protein n=1 Tax=Astatotilapia calliptera TaxID=8154 RepID=A0AAX7VMJ6_ASTCA